MSNTFIEVELVNYKMEYVARLRLPQGTIPGLKTKFHTKISKFGIYRNSEYIVDDIITEYIDTDNSDGYGNYGDTTVKVKLVVTLLSFETNKPTEPIRKESVKKTRNKKQ